MSVDTLGLSSIADDPSLIVVGWVTVGSVDTYSREISDAAGQTRRHETYGELAHTCIAGSLLNLEYIGTVGLGRVFAAALQSTANFDTIVAVYTPRIYVIMCRDIYTL